MMDAKKVDALGVLDRAIAREYNPFEPDNQSVLHGDLKEARDAIAELIETQRETLRMLEAAHRQLGMWTGDNKRIQRAKSVLSRIGAPA